jgi:hypothetical protein
MKSKSMANWAVPIGFFVAWLFGFAVFHVAGLLIHILFVLGVVAIVWNLTAGRKAANGQPSVGRAAIVDRVATLRELAALRDAGHLTPTEYEAEKQLLLATGR